MQAEPARLVRRLLRKRHLGEQLLPPTPRRPQPPEHRPVPVTTLTEDLVRRLHRQRLGTHGRPLLVEPGRCGLGDRLRQEARGMGGPILPGALGAGVDGDGATFGRARPDDHTDLDAAPLGQHQRRREGQFLQGGAVDGLAGRQGQFDEDGTGQQDPAQDDVVGEPGLRLHRQPARQYHAAGVRQSHHRTQQRVFGGVESDVLRRRGSRAGRGEPVALPLEGVRRQVDGTGTGPGEEAGPVDRGARGVQVCERGEESERLVAALAGRRHEQDGGILGTVEAGPGHPGQDRLGADLDAAVHSGGAECADTVGEPDGPADVRQPVVRGGQFAGLGDPAGHVGHHRHQGLRERQSLHDLTERREHRLHQRRVERVRDAEPADPAPALPEHLGDRLDGLLHARDHHRGRAVDGGDRHAFGLVEVQLFPDLLLGGLHRHHGAAGGKRLHQPATRGDQRTGVREGEHPGDVCRRHLTDGVAGHQVGSDAPGRQEPEQCHLDGEQTRLRVRGAVQRLGVLAPHHCAQRTLQVLVESRAHRVESLREHREVLVQITPHAEALGALTREQEGGGADGPCLPGDHAGGVRALREGPQAGQDLVSAGAEHHRAGLQRGAGGGQRVRRVQRTVVRACRRVIEQPGCLGAQRLGGGRGQCPEQDGGCGAPGGGVRSGCGPRFVRGPGGALLQYDVCVGAAEAEGGDAGPAGTAGGRPGPFLGDQFGVALGPVDVRGRTVDVQGARHRAVFHRHDHLDDAGDTGGGLRVADVRLDRAEQQRPVLGPVLAVRGEERLRLDRIAERGARTVRLHHVDLGRGDSGAQQRLADHALLGGAVGGGQPVARAVLVDGRALDDREHPVPVAHRVRETFHQEHADALGPADTVRRARERLAAAVDGQTALAAELDEHAGRRHHGGATCHGERALPRPQRLHRQVQRDERGRAGGVDGDGRAFPAVGVREPTGRHAATGGAGGRDVERVVVVHHTGEDTGPAALERGGVDARPLQGLPRGLEQHALLRVHVQGLTG